MERFAKCQGCGYDFATGEGERSCSLGECAYLPEELNVFCNDCRFNFFTMEGNSPCEDPLRCEHALEPLAYVANEVGWVSHVIVNRRSGHLVDGHLRVSLARPGAERAFCPCHLRGLWSG